MWKYEPDEQPKRKHAWGQPHPGFIEVAGVPVGKCPKTISNAQAEQALNNGIPYFPARHHATWPKRIYVLHDGTVYRAVPTLEGSSYHAFPEQPEEFRKLPRPIREQILSQAKALGVELKLQRWMKT